MHYMGMFLVTGATRGIGAATVAELHGRGHTVLALGRDSARLERMRREFERVVPVVADLAEPERLAAAVAAADVARLDGLVHCAAIGTIAPVERTDVSTWQETFAVNVIAPAELTRALLPALRATRGRVVFVGAGRGIQGAPGWSSHAASKVAMQFLADAVRNEEAPHGIRVSTVYPGATDTALLRALRRQSGRDYDPDKYTSPSTVATLIATALEVPDDAHLTDLYVRSPG